MSRPPILFVVAFTVLLPSCSDDLPSIPETPGASIDAPIDYVTVLRGDSYWSLAEHYLGSGARWPELAAMNLAEEPYTLRVGQRVRVR